MDEAEERDPVRTATLEAYADTIIPGVKRGPDDRSIAGVVSDGGAVQAGAIELLEGAEGGLAPMLDTLVEGLNAHAQRYATEQGLTLDETAPPFVALSFADRTDLVRSLTAPGHPEKELWTAVAIFSYMAFDSAAHLHTTDAIAGGHVGLRTLGYTPPDPDGLWRFPDHSYGRPLAPLHPDTDPATGSLP